MAELKVQERTALGKKTRALRRAGLVPGEIYGRGIENRHVAVPVKGFTALYRTAGSHTVITLAIGDEKIPAVITDVVRDPLSGEVLAVDFHAIRKDEKIRAKVPVVFVGTAPAVKNGFVVVEVMREMEIEALPHELLHRVEVSIEKLEKPGDSVSVRELALPPTVKLHVPDDAVLATVREHAKEVAPAPAPPAESVPTEGTPAAAEGAPPAEEKKE
jgi:large subunit ribosomal protein L25